MTSPPAPPDGFDGGFRVAALGEVAIRCRDLAAMTAFYRDVIGLEVLSERDAGIVFFRVAEGFAGHTSVLALFDAGRPAGASPGGEAEAGPRSSLHHLALTVSAADQARAVDWYARIGRPHRIEDFDWIGWRGVFTTDPEGNTVELVASIRGGSAEGPE